MGLYPLPLRDRRGPRKMNFTYCNATSETQSGRCTYNWWPILHILTVFTADDEVPLWRGYTFHHFGLILSALFGLIAVTMSCFLMYMHATHYLKPWEQKQYVQDMKLWSCSLANWSQHNSYRVHGSDLCYCVIPLIHVLPSRDLLSGPPRLLRSLCNRKFFRTPLCIYCAGSARTKRLFSEYKSKALAEALVACGDEGMDQNPTERSDVV